MDAAEEVYHARPVECGVGGEGFFRVFVGHVHVAISSFGLRGLSSWPNGYGFGELRTVVCALFLLVFAGVDEVVP